MLRKSVAMAIFFGEISYFHLVIALLVQLSSVSFFKTSEDVHAPWHSLKYLVIIIIIIIIFKNMQTSVKFGLLNEY